MRKIMYPLLLLIGVVMIAACSNGETYADQKKRERAAISKYVADSAVNVISETEFATQNYTTDVSKNQWVLFESTGVYMQIVRKGVGSPIQDGETTTVLCRFTERNMLTDSIQLSNILIAAYSYFYDRMSVTNNSGTFTGSFDSSQSLMYQFYSTTSVPEGWLVPLRFINIGRQTDEEGQIAKVRLIVPHDKGQSSAISSVYPCLYDITYQRGR
ncbi:MAG: DUF4827 domain-containing protein [Prevotella sp.]|nr:DUF4827 domain-containing protein [Prevotella sp.]